ncbi:MAG: Methionyl-tRNA formyltransferase [Candidatus Collierbacteria bacterium GW2011_GWD2_45_10]|nr:MAG: Methionyl-tRNA formyltransferase [Candidatus Collierbacteria bacterium GW2011_GWA2_44_13]KKT62501.1 MAG: Methionyl-tRNA formyltransferase [Candidatus Collierbacteria bacterium GW2011_GWD1_44_27]KKT88750.1 MAG: Methionyl-tRNA formyltransferase [Candidatus Collierbacteria bacterium GW2011_GWD2_45_10]
MLKNLVYFGSPDFSAQILESIIGMKMVNVVGVVTTPDMPLGRKQILTPSSVSLTAQKHDLPIYKPAKLDDTNLTHVKLLKPDIFMVVSYGKIIPLTWINAPTIGIYNVHFSLLPGYRGALCISEAIKNQDTNTGVTLMEMDEQLDHGPIISQISVAIDLEDNVATLTTKLTQAAKEILRQKLPEICAQNYSKTVQDESLATFTPSHRTVSRESAFIPWEILSQALSTNNQELITKTHALIRSLNPEPGAWTCLPAGTAKIDNLEIKIIKTSLLSGKLIVNTVQISGKNPISWKQFLSGHPISGLK